jgi:endonuclease/exonuclease/phosphatase family metal-dependent hydrolase
MKLSVLQWNVWFRENADNIVQFIQEQDADIVCLQELTQNSTTNPLRDIPAELAALGYHAVYKPALQQSGKENIVMGNGIFSKFPIVGQRQVFVQHEDPKSNNYAHENRIYIEAAIKADDTYFTVGTVHLSYITEFQINEQKRREVDTLISAIAQNAQRYIFTGDLNSLPDSYTVEGLRKTLKSAGPDYTQATWTTKPFSYEGFEANTLEWRLDYVFTTPDIAVLDSRIIKTEFSDHLPILTTIEI